MNLSLEKEELISDGINAVGPGKVSKSILFSTHSLTSKKPGSEIDGVPASETNANIFPDFNFSMILEKVLNF